MASEPIDEVALVTGAPGLQLRLKGERVVLLLHGKGVRMNRFKKALAAPVAIVVVLVAAAPASADPPEGSCGLGSAVAHEAIANTDGPGASEDARVSPASVGCTGHS